jgi:S-adenosylmethionine hydrolase
VLIRIGKLNVTAPYVTTFGDVPIGQPLLYIDSSGLLSLAVNQGSFAKVHDVTPPVEIFVARRKER